VVIGSKGAFQMVSDDVLINEHMSGTCLLRSRHENTNKNQFGKNTW